MLAGCAHPLPPTVAGQRPLGVGGSLVEAGAAPRVEKAVQPPAPSVTPQVAKLDVSAPVGTTPKDAQSGASAQKQPASQVGQLADSLMLVFMTFTGH